MIGSRGLRRAARPRRRGRRALARSRARSRSTNPTVELARRGIPRRERPPAAAFEGVDAVVNLIGENINQRLTPAAKERIHDSRVRATKNLVDGMAGAERTPGVLVSQCAVGYYGDHGEAIVDESTPPAEDWTGRLCADWEAAAMDAASGGRPRRRAPQRAGARSGWRPPEAAPPALQARRRRAARRRSPVHAVDPPRRRGRAVPLGARHRRRSAVRSTPARPTPVTNREFSKALGPCPSPSRDRPDPPLRSGRDARRGADRPEHPGHATASARRRVQLPRGRPALRDLLGR